MQTSLVFDLSNIAYICAHRFFGKSFEDEFNNKLDNKFIENEALFLLNKLEDSMRQIYLNFSPDKVWFACDSQDGYYWRHDMFPDYKANREMTPIKRLVRAAVKLFINKNKKLCLENKLCEADDVIYALTKFVPGHITIVSTDGDFVQLISQRVRVYTPRAKKFRVNKDSKEYYLFIKSIRGDKSDNIPSAYPYVTTKVLNQAFANEKKRQALLDTKLDIKLDNKLDNKLGDKDQDNIVDKAQQVQVKNQFELNMNLVDLSKIPEGLFGELEVLVNNLCVDMKASEVPKVKEVV